MTKVRVTWPGGSEQELAAGKGRQLMEALRDNNTGVQGTCGGQCACGTCHVYVREDWAGRLPPRTEDEQAMLDAIGELVEIRPTSRLSCQIVVDDTLAGISVEIGPVP